MRLFSEAYTGISLRVGLRELQHPLGPENPLEIIDFTNPGGGLSPIATTPLCRCTPLVSFALNVNKLLKILPFQLGNIMIPIKT